MKKYIFFLAIMGLMVACSSGSKQKGEVSEDLKKQTEVIEQTIQKSDELIKKSESDFKTNKNEIDSLLNNL